MGLGDIIWHLPFNKLIKPPTARKFPGVMNPPHYTIIHSELILIYIQNKIHIQDVSLFYSDIIWLLIKFFVLLAKEVYVFLIQISFEFIFLLSLHSVNQNTEKEKEREECEKGAGRGVRRKERRKKRHCFLKVKCIFSCVKFLSMSFVKYILIQFPNCEICQNILHVPSPAPNPAQDISLGFFEPISRLLTWSH